MRRSARVVPLSQLRSGSLNKRLKSCGGEQAADLPEVLVVDEVLNKDAN